MFTSKIDKSKAELQGSGPQHLSAAEDDLAGGPATSLDRVVIRGLFRLNDDGELEVGGQVEGDIKCHALTILSGGAIEGNVQADRILVEGAFDGNIETNHLVIASAAHLVSDDVLVHDSVIIEPEAHFEGQLRRPGREAEAAANEAAAKKPAPKPAAQQQPNETRAAAARKDPTPVKRGKPEDEGGKTKS